MLTLNDGRAELWQWDTGRTLAVDADCSQVHFSNKVFGRSIDVDVVDGAAVIPDILLQTDKDLNVWAFVGTADNGYTKISKTFKVNRRNKPSDYVFTPTDQMTLQTIQSQIGDLAYLTTEAKDTLVAAINEAARTGGGAGSMDLRVADGYVQYSTDGGMTWTNLIAMAELKGADGITPTIGSNGNWYLGDTDTGKPSRGETGPVGADGRDGADGQPGADGKSAYAYAMEGGYTGTEAEFAAKLAEEKFANPNALTFTGAVTGSYDGSAPLSVEIPSGGGSGGDSGWEYLGEFTNDAQPTFEIGKYNLFFVSGYATVEAIKATAYLRPSIDGTRHFPWTISFDSVSKKFFGLFAPNFSIAYIKNGSGYPDMTDRGNASASMAETDDMSKGTAYITLSGGGAGAANLTDYKMKIYGKP